MKRKYEQDDHTTSLNGGGEECEPTVKQAKANTSPNINPHDQNKSIISDIKFEHDTKPHLRYFLKLLEDFDDDHDNAKFSQGITNSVLGYFNKFLNGLPEIIGSNYEQVDDGVKTWHAEKIGAGGFGTVLKVIKRNSNGQNVKAIKVIPIISTMGPNEAVSGAKLDHPNVVKVYNSILIR